MRWRVSEFKLQPTELLHVIDHVTRMLKGSSHYCLGREQLDHMDSIDYCERNSVTRGRNTNGKNH